MKQKITITLSIIIAATIIFFACQDEELPKVTGINKIELTLVEDSTSYVFAQLQCDLNQNPKFEIEQYGYCWDTVASVNIEKQSNNFENLSSQSFTESIENLLPNKTYYIKAYILNGDVVIYSNELTIQTLDARPVVTTSDISNILANSAQAGGAVEAYETLFPITQRGVCWAKTQNPTIADSLTNNGTGNGTFTSQLQNLDIGVNYYVRAYAINSEGINYGEEKNFSALDGIPNLTTDSIRNITATSATFYGNIVENDGLEILEKGFCWSTTANPTISNNSQIVTGNALGSYNTEITGLEINTTYYIKSYIKNSEGTFYGNEIDFTTEDGLPILITTAISNITATSASSGGNITDDGGFAISAYGICWNTSSNPTISDNYTTDGTGTGSFTSNITGLNVSTTYYVRAYATNVNGTVYGEEYNFITEDGIATITTNNILDITAISAISGGIITDDGGAPIIKRGICWNTNVNPTVNDLITIDGNGIGSYTSSLTGLEMNTTYYVRAYAINSVDTAYGNQVNFTTDDGIPIITTTNISNINATSASSGGEITDDGGLAITARGVCWSISSNPTIDNNKTSDGTGLGIFTSSLTGLTEWTKYYVRAYVTNINGTTYGNEISFEAKQSLTDYDGNIYEIVKIGDQIWMAENLKTTHYSDGTAITLVENQMDWDALTETDKAYCYYDNSSTNKDAYGTLYTWAAAMNGAASSNVVPSGVQGACPIGWHLPSDDEWKELEIYLGMSQVDADAGGIRGTNEGSKLAGNVSLWQNGTLNSDPEFGQSNFLALPSGSRNYAGEFHYLYSHTYFWSATELDITNAWCRSIAYNYSEIARYQTSKSGGFSIRCIKD